MNKTKNKITICNSEDAFIEQNSRWLVTLLKEEIDKKGEVVIAISGGSTPIPIYKSIALEYSKTIAWTKVKVFWVDERCVSPDHDQSNYLHAVENFINKVGIRDFFRIKGEISPIHAAIEYESLLKKKNIIFDLVWLGMGADGHTASLFPNTHIINEDNKLVSEVFVPKLDAWRVSLTYTTILKAKRRLISFKGKEKFEVFEQVKGGDESFPISRIYNFGFNNDFIIYNDNV